MLCYQVLHCCCTVQYLASPNNPYVVYTTRYSTQGCSKLLATAWASQLVLGNNSCLPSYDQICMQFSVSSQAKKWENGGSWVGRYDLFRYNFAACTCAERVGQRGEGRPASSGCRSCPPKEGRPSLFYFPPSIAPSSSRKQLLLVFFFFLSMVGEGKLSKKLSASKTIEKNGGKAGAGGNAKKRGRSEAPPSPASVAAPSSGDAMRDKVRKLLCDALFQKGEDIVKGRDAAMSIAVDVECAMFDQLGGVSKDYKMKARELKFNFSDDKNKDLREEVLTQTLLAQDLIKMSSKDLANAEMKAERQKMHEYFLREAAAGNKPAATTSEFRCGKCKKRECTYYQMQTRSADEPLTTFVQCVACGNRWRF